jgi:membrane fusion protein (multidrug efflux system)
MARLGLKPGENTNSIKEEQTTEVLRARAALDEAQGQYRRAKNLFDEKIGTQQAVDQADAAYKTAQANYRASIDSVRALKAQIEQYRAAAELAKKKLYDTTLRAPFPGSIQQRHIAQGQYLKVQAPAFSIVQTNPLRLRAEVAERFAYAVRANQQVKVAVDGVPQPFAARISRVSPAVTEQSRTLLVEALVENSQQSLRPGLFARASIVSDQTENVLLVPARAVVNFYGINKVFAVNSGKVQERVVKLGDRFGDQFEILEGLKPEEVVATSNLEKLAMGTPVEVVGGRQSVAGSQ